MTSRSRVLAGAACCLLAQAASAGTYTADVWADNWFELRVDGVVAGEDGVPITTERSFNAERFSFEAEPPFTLGLVAMDFKENDTGLEYIGTGRQQMGDGGVIAQIRDAAGDVVAVTDAAWRCLVTHAAPLDKRCKSQADPVAGEGYCGFAETAPSEGWDAAGFDDGDWQAATVHAASAVSPKDGYDRVDWVEPAQLIWGPDLETDNTLLCRLEVR